MGNINSINFKERSNGIFKIDVKDIPDYPIAYIRLCWDPEKSIYCVPEDCDTEKKFKQHRKIIVVGMRIPEISKDDIYEQAFYLSSGSNSIQTLEKSFETKFTLKNETENIWLPFSGFGYDDSLTEIKLLKNNFNCVEIKEPDCLYGRFSRYTPNLMQISYCLGGDFWYHNIDNPVFTKYKIIKYPTLEDSLKKIPCIHTGKHANDIDCSIYLNNYIGSALPFNYYPKLLRDYKEVNRKTYTRFIKIPGLDFNDIKFDFRISNILYQNNIYLYRLGAINKSIPIESRFGSNILWDSYIKGIHTIYKDKRDIFDTQIIPILHSIKQDTIKDILKD
jgi:hypothetical protein